MKALFVLTAFLLFSLNVFAEKAQTKPAGQKSSGKNKVIYEKSTDLSFDGRSLDGDIVNPNGAAVEADKNLYFESMFEERKDFKSELKRSTGALR